MLNIKLYVQILQNVDILFKYYLLSYYAKISEEILNIELKNKKLLRMYSYIYNGLASIAEFILRQFHVINSLHLWQILAKHRKR